MKNIKQVELISQVLNKERDKILLEVMKVNSFIAKKIAGIKKMIDYQKEYSGTNKFILTQATPTLHKNFDSFSKKLKNIIIHEEDEIRKLIVARAAKLNKVIIIDQKISLMAQFTDKIKIERLQEVEKFEQIDIDDLSPLKSSRGDYE